MSEQVQKKFSERGWGWLLGQINPVAENIIQRLIKARSTEHAGPADAKPSGEIMSPLSPEEWINMMDSEGRFSPENAHELMRRAFYGVCAWHWCLLVRCGSRHNNGCLANRASQRTSGARRGSIC